MNVTGNRISFAGEALQYQKSIQFQCCTCHLAGGFLFHVGRKLGNSRISVSTGKVPGINQFAEVYQLIQFK